MSPNFSESHFDIIPEKFGHESRWLPGRPSAKAASVCFVKLSADAFWLTDAL